MTVKIHDWSEVRGNVFRRKPTPKMLLPEGDVIRGSFMLSGDSTYSVREEKFVKYDVNYIEAKLANDFLAPLSQSTLLGLEDLINRAKTLKEGEECL
jgi:hypothetical protein